MSASTLIAVAVALSIAGCERAPAPEPPAPHPVRVDPPAPPERCEVAIVPAEPPPGATGRASAASTEEADAAAWAMACAKLPESAEPCDPEHVTVEQRSNRVAIQGGITTATVEVSIRRKQTRVDAAADSDASLEAACRKAERAACAIAGAAEDCVDSGTWTVLQ